MFTEQEKEYLIVDSMWRIFGSVNSPTEKRRPLATYKFIKFLIENPEKHRVADIIEAFKGELDDIVISRVANSLGYAGIIDFESPYREIKGKRTKRWAKYYLKRIEESDDEIYEKIRKIGSQFKNKGYLFKTIDYIREHENEPYECNELSERLKIGKGDVSRCLSLLERVGILSCEFKGREQISRATMNELTNMLYDIVLEPAHEEAYFLHPIPATFNSNWINEFLENYQEERSKIGPEGGEEVRSFILSLLESGEMKVSQIAEEWNMKADRKLSIGAIYRHLNEIEKEGKIEKVRKGYYKLSSE